ncbi:MAG TPA: DUF445 domain-containing protein [Arcobacter sp.]|nr:DUF445 domain-containing protein [Arcobacter sp.]HIP55603.1 DUF445 domain-containing protein [Arcobacter sp.]
MNKSLITNLIAVLLIVLGFILQNNIILTIGLFALSGAVTNWIAIHMLFEKVPFLYGSGVVENRFEEFKVSIYKLIMEQFFTKENLDKFFESESSAPKQLDLSKVIDKTDFSIAFESLKSAVMESSFGGMLGMFGGVAALEPLKEPFELKMKASINEIVHTDAFQTTLREILSSGDISDGIQEKIQAVVYERLEELDAKMIKNLVQDMMKEHLGWLVVWGGFFGGLIGLVSSSFL